MSAVADMPWLSSALVELQGARAEGRLPHALLITGPRGVGETQLAEHLTRWLLCDQPGEQAACGRCAQCLLMVENDHPDHHRIEPLRDDKGKAKRSIAVAQVRELITDLTLKPLRAAARVAVFHPAELMNDAAQNALLKTLEEPVGTTYLLLLASRPTRLLPTVRSRCSSLTLRAPARGEAEAWLAANGPAGSDWGPLLDLTGGAPVAALELAEEGAAEDLDLVSLVRDLEGAVLALAEGRADPASVAEHFTSVPLPLLLTWIQRLLHQLAQQAAGLSDAGLGGLRGERLQRLLAGIDLHRLYEYSDQVSLARRSEDAPLNRQLQLEALFAPWGRQLVPGQSGASR